MSKMKKLLACLLTAALVTTSVVPVFANSGGPEDDPGSSIVEADSWGNSENAPEEAKVELSSDDGTASLGSVKSEKKKVEVSGEVTVGDETFVVTELQSKAFSGCKAANTITVSVSPKAETYTVSKNAFLGCAGAKIVLNAKNFSGWNIAKGAFGKHSGGKKLVIKRSGTKKPFTAKQKKKMRKMLKEAGFNGKVSFK